MSCTRELTITIEAAPSDMPLDSAVYVSGRDKIFGARGGYVLQFNASTGALENSSRFAAPAFGDSYITYDSVNDRLYCSHWFNYQNMNKFALWQRKFLYKINPDTLSVVSSHQFDSGFFGVSGVFHEGPRQIFAAAGKVYGVFHSGSASTTSVYEFDPGTGLFNNAGTEINSDYRRADIVYDSVLDAFWVTNQNDGAQRWDRTSMTQTVAINLTSNDQPRGLAYRSPDMYFVMSEFGTILPQHVRKKRIDDTGAITTIDTGRPNAIPFNIKYRASNDRIYVPTTLDNTVVIINPTTDTVESVKTGFDSPWDVLFTGSKAFAVQHGPEGLKEIV